MAETSLDGALLGQVFTCLIGQQFANLKDGDRYTHVRLFKQGQQNWKGGDEIALNKRGKTCVPFPLCMLIPLTPKSFELGGNWQSRDNLEQR